MSLLLILCCYFTAGMSEDSDYTSDISYPLQHQHNTSAHQYRSHGEHPYRLRDERDFRGEYGGPYDSFEGVSFDRGGSFDNIEAESFEQDRGSFEQEVSFEQGDDSFERGESFERVESIDREFEQGLYEQEYERERDYYQQGSPYHQIRSDTDSEPLFYNSRPNSRPRPQKYYDEW